ncbi:MAG: hypothetical protein ABI629_23020 [bacterium]
MHEGTQSAEATRETHRNAAGTAEIVETPTPSEVDERPAQTPRDAVADDGEKSMTGKPLGGSEYQRTGKNP